MTRPPSPMVPFPMRPSVRRCGASRLTAITESQRASSMFLRSLSRVIPALLTKMSALPPWCSLTCAVMASTASSEVTSSASAVPPTREASSFSSSDGMSIATTAAPSRANTSAMVSPIPRAAPVTMATLPASGLSQSAGAVESSAPT
ncbi:Uncharacterised protein [Mycobacteroides abscessus subsp. abscessus]|nr:Uncharacterised protein [Mycobacteroides abscessus]SKV84571.1 Uncharacterised protein [Mycobacteroides abscessus subsp. abscessus]